MPRRRRQHNQAHANYPADGSALIDDSIKYKAGVVAAVKAFARAKPYRGSTKQRRKKFADLHMKLCEIYGLDRIALQFRGGAMGNGQYCPGTREITLFGPLSVVTYLHEFAHALYGSCEVQAVRWSVNLFKRCFPRSYARLEWNGHMLVKPRGDRERTRRLAGTRRRPLDENEQMGRSIGRAERRAVREIAEIIEANPAEIQALLEEDPSGERAVQALEQIASGDAERQQGADARMLNREPGARRCRRVSRRGGDVTPDDLGENV